MSTPVDCQVPFTSAHAHPSLKIPHQSACSVHPAPAGAALQSPGFPDRLSEPLLVLRLAASPPRQGPGHPPQITLTHIKRTLTTLGPQLLPTLTVWGEQPGPSTLPGEKVSHLRGQHHQVLALEVFSVEPGSFATCFSLQVLSKLQPAPECLT